MRAYECSNLIFFFLVYFEYGMKKKKNALLKVVKIQISVHTILLSDISQTKELERTNTVLTKGIMIEIRVR